MANQIRNVHVIDSHTAGEPTRTVIAGGPNLGNGTVADQLTIFKEQHNKFRSAVVNEPRGSDALVGALLVPPADKTCATGVIFFNNVGVLGMCGHGTIWTQAIRFVMESAVTAAALTPLANPEVRPIVQIRALDETRAATWVTRSTPRAVTVIQLYPHIQPWVGLRPPPLDGLPYSGRFGCTKSDRRHRTFDDGTEPKANHREIDHRSIVR